jgi:hypothetical protein
VLRSFAFVGGPHHGEHVDDEGEPPTSLFAISFADGAAYARAGLQRRDDVGTLREVFRFDLDGSLTDRARREFAPELD